MAICLASLTEQKSILQARTKEFERFRKKLFDKRYNDPEEMVDIVGIRIIGYVKSDIMIICGLNRDNFYIIEEINPRI
jgi:ppGpp synthetase/RelA/SpoT-type nucleotidyltranferase